MSNPTIRVRGLRRTYGTGTTAYEAVRGIDLDVVGGTITALLGTNGAGKTSAMEVIEGLHRPDAGSVEVLGLDPVADRAQVRRRVGVLLQDSGFAGDLSVAETLRMWSDLITAPRPVAEALELLDLTHRGDVTVRALSGGERRRLDLACTLLARPEVLLLDEPTTALDPESRHRVWQLVERLRDEGATVLLTTHYLEEAEALADRLEIMHAGRIVRSGTPAEIAEGHPSVIRFRTPAQAPAQWLSDLPLRHAANHDTTTLEVDDLQGVLGAVLDRAATHGLRLERLEARPASLEAVFLSIAGSQPLSADQPATQPAAQPEGATR
ncbi:ABC transporter ATP-binding protein [Nocardioides sp. zg-536]|uniref:ABC transporter ATP-binding protein n=1 Tax=Nocardioides faecalis TaxID=2803858 RepID=A0A938XZ52_9ACTN|nr:ABC transporter ATP-binding protein [Nocardioides faecalis]MBM9458881.1 ABC transporter ATP-binding protein [Nocardioides faecalis]MBS4754023.1 ABC transporter ATP-binding protein [Nocardioides faecalis]QVI60285.1 ABC transporter ATP-binding protein [Nocardioides faecalis]